MKTEATNNNTPCNIVNLFKKIKSRDMDKDRLHDIYVNIYVIRNILKRRSNINRAKKLMISLLDETLIDLQMLQVNNLGN